MRALLVAVVLSMSCARAPVSTAEPECTGATTLVAGVPGSPGHLITSERNPNGDSQLAALMRQMVADWTQERATLDVPMSHAKRLPLHRTMRCAWPTVPADRTPQFDALAVSYLAQVEAYDAAPSRATYQNVVSGCRACHDQSCPGPLVVIDALEPPPSK